MKETYITILEGIYKGATARVHMDNQVSEEIPILRGVRQGDPISPKLSTATIQEVFENVQLEKKGMNIDGETLSDLRFADDVGVKNMKHHLNTVNKESLKLISRHMKEKPNL